MADTSRTSLPLAPSAPVPAARASRGASEIAADGETRAVGTGVGGVAGVGPGVEDRVRRVLELIRPAIQSDGGDLEYIGLTPAGIVQIRLHGACVGCPSSAVTLQMGIERNLREHIPEVRGVEALD